MVPWVAVQLIPVLEEPVTTAVYVAVVPAVTVFVEGETVTVTAGGGGGGGGAVTDTTQVPEANPSAEVAVTV